jgi:hypothetical protein
MLGLNESLVDLIPMFYLLLLCGLDLHKEFHLKMFFCPIIQEIHKKREVIRNGICQGVNNPTNVCPVFNILRDNEIRIPEDCPKLFYTKNDDPEPLKKSKAFWQIIINGIELFHQSTFFELVAIQIIIFGVVLNSGVIRNLSIVLGVFVLVVGVAIYTYHFRTRIFLFSNAWVRLIFVVGFMIMFVALTSYVNLDTFDQTYVNFLASRGFAV